MLLMSSHPSLPSAWKKTTVNLINTKLSPKGLVHISL